MNSTMPLVELRVVARPYLVFAPFALGVFLICITKALKAPDLRAAIHEYRVMSVFVPPYFILYLGFWMYRVRLFTKEIVDRGFLKFTKRVPLALIFQVKPESGWPSQTWSWASRLRPYRRIVLYYDDGTGRKYFDISLTHFSIAKVRELLAELKKLRPDLDIPTLGKARKLRKSETTSE